MMNNCVQKSSKSIFFIIRQQSRTSLFIAFCTYRAIVSIFAVRQFIEFNRNTIKLDITHYFYNSLFLLYRLIFSQFFPIVWIFFQHKGKLKKILKLPIDTHKKYCYYNLNINYTTVLRSILCFTHFTKRKEVIYIEKDKHKENRNIRIVCGSYLYCHNAY